MRASDRERLKALVDARRRELVADEFERGHCVECGGAHAGVTLGCNTCRERATQRETRRRRREVEIPVGEQRRNRNGRLMAPVRATHGSEATYQRWKCRCDACREAASAARRQRRQTPHVKVHGDVGYRNGCRCDACRAGYREFNRARAGREAQTAA